MSLQKGLVHEFFDIHAFKLEELFSSHTENGDGGFNFVMMGFWMNQKVWDSLSPKTQQVSDEASK